MHSSLLPLQQQASGCWSGCSPFCRRPARRPRSCRRVAPTPALVRLSSPMTASATTVALDPLLACAPSVSSALALTLALSLAPSLNPKSPNPHLSPTPQPRPKPGTMPQLEWSGPDPLPRYRLQRLQASTRPRAPSMYRPARQHVKLVASGLSRYTARQVGLLLRTDPPGPGLLCAHLGGGAAQIRSPRVRGCSATVSACQANFAPSTSRLADLIVNSDLIKKSVYIKNVDVRDTM